MRSISKKCLGCTENHTIVCGDECVDTLPLSSVEPMQGSEPLNTGCLTDLRDCLPKLSSTQFVSTPRSVSWSEQTPRGAGVG